MRRIRPAGSGLQALTAMASRRWADGSFILVAILLLGGILAGCGYGGGARVRNAAAFAPMPAIQLRGVAAGQHRARTHRPRAIKCDASFSSGNTCRSLPKELQRLARWIGESADMKEGAMRLVQLGDEMASQNGEKIPTSMRKEALKVPGCVSTVLVVSSVGEKGEVSLLGEADARVARGMLALLVRGLAGENASTVATVDSEKLISLARLRDWLPRGRNDGMTNMVETIARATSAALERKSRDDTSSTAAASHAPDIVQSVSDLGSGAWAYGGSGEEIAVLLSGGVDSSVALELIRRQGFTPKAFYLKIWLEDELAHLGECPWEEDWDYASKVAQLANTPLEGVSLQREYWDQVDPATLSERMIPASSHLCELLSSVLGESLKPQYPGGHQVVQYLIAESRAGRTPNPDVMCNSRIKFGMFYEYVGRHL